MVKTKLKYVIPTFFTCFVQILTAHGKKFLLGGSDPRVTLATEACAKVGRCSPTRCFAHAQIDRRAVRTSCSLSICLIAKVTARVTHVVICVFHAPVTFPGCE
jgi:hypothetical protein